MTTDMLRVFYSYSHADAILQRQLMSHLRTLEREGFVSGWHDRRIDPGEAWRGVIDSNLRDADIILLLISADFIDSDYCTDEEMRIALERHTAGEARVIPVILRDCDWSGLPFADLQTLPANGEPVRGDYWSHEDKAFAGITSALRRVVKKRVGARTSTLPSPADQASDSLRSDADLDLAEVAREHFLTGAAERDRKNVALLVSTIARIMSADSPDTFNEAVIDQLLEMTGAERGVLLLLDEDGKARVKAARDAEGKDLGADIKFSRSVVLRVLSEGSAVALIDTADSEVDLGSSVLDLKLITLMCAPLRVGEETLGVVYVDSRATTREFSSADLIIFRLVSSLVAAALSRSQRAAAAAGRLDEGADAVAATSILARLRPPQNLPMAGYEVHSHSLPPSVAGSEFVDFLHARTDHLGLVIANSGSVGLEGATLAATVRGALHALARVDEDLAWVTAELNRVVTREARAGAVMSMILADLDLPGRTLRHVSAGNNGAIHYDAASEEIRPLPEHGLPLGLPNDPEYIVAGPLPLGPGDVLVMFSDGVLAARSPQGEPFGMDRLVEAVRATRRSFARVIAATVAERVEEFCCGAEPTSDRSLIVVRVKG